MSGSTRITAGIKTCEVNIGGVTTKYVSKDDYDALKLVHEALEVAADVQRKNYLHHVADLELKLSRSDWQWYKDSLEAIQRRYEAELDMYRKPIVFEPVSSLTFKCDCGVVCSSRAGLLSHVRRESVSDNAKVRARHITFAAAFDTLYPTEVRPMKDVGW
jgi:hypothetical protein